MTSARPDPERASEGAARPLTPEQVAARWECSPNEADDCRAKGWVPGTYLVGDEGYGPTIIKITALGEEMVLARAVSHNGQPRHGRETCWTLTCRDWTPTRFNEPKSSSSAEGKA